MCQHQCYGQNSKQNSLVSYSGSKEADNKHIDQRLDSTRPHRNILGFVHHLVSVTTTKFNGLGLNQPQEQLCSTKTIYRNQIGQDLSYWHVLLTLDIKLFSFTNKEDRIKWKGDTGQDCFGYSGWGRPLCEWMKSMPKQLKNKLSVSSICLSFKNICKAIS